MVIICTASINVQQLHILYLWVSFVFFSVNSDYFRKQR
jgi:hypothetical protein